MMHKVKKLWQGIYDAGGPRRRVCMDALRHPKGACKNAWQAAYAGFDSLGCRRVLWAMDVFRQIARDPAAAPRKIAGKLRAGLADRIRARRDARTPSYDQEPPQGAHRPCFTAPPLESLRPHAREYAALARLTLEHRFDLLGSGWVKLDRGEQRQGLDGGVHPPLEPRPDAGGRWLAATLSPNNLHCARRLRGQISPGFAPISWNEDFKTGFVWPASQPSRSLRYADRHGVDVKVPWELARMQHLPWLAFAAMLSRDGQPGFEAPERYLREIKDQMLDFASACPPRFGPNWLCTMDVAIRAANLIATHDILASAGFSLDEGFVLELRRTLWDHFTHIVNNIEYHPVVRANHYYSDIVGLLFVSAWLPETPRTTAALAWAVQEYLGETPVQFHADGANFEASTSYHRLCGELVTYGAALVMGLPAATVAGLRKADASLWAWQPPLQSERPWLEEDRILLPREIMDRVARAGDFLLDYSAEAGEIFQIGDNDSGRLFKFLPALSFLTCEELAPFGLRPEAGVSPEPFERINDHRHLAAAIAGLLPRADLLALAPEHPETHLVRGLARFAQTPALRPARAPSRLRAYPGFGLYFYALGEIHLALRCGSNGQHDNGGHAHNDQLSLCLAKGGRLFLVDPGTYVYTPLPRQRNRFRATRHHNTLFVPKKEQNSFSATSLFTLLNEARPELLECSESVWSARHQGFAAPHTRTVRLPDAGMIEVEDSCNLEDCRLALHLHPEVRVRLLADGTALLERDGVELSIALQGLAWELEEFAYSPGYGLVQAAQRLVSAPFTGMAVWSIG
ncbi:MAG TPA: alginate lyase family protein [Humidesulfovibrio sp.]|uniref:alginate lyase family protein n=1 Tax=Humidesulfovibrio sp. TaxID=2910988 RepID=UPI002C8689F3|nr:alginate lyase family protein [Humidesulfovibrio sp.]HWR02652.1 alginate lyase family protein [Humidesulfovibrio sp.]